jgi:hypothetical protein
MQIFSFFFFGFICYLHDIGKEKNDFYSFPAEKNLKRLLYNADYTLTSSGFFKFLKYFFFALI